MWHYFKKDFGFTIIELLVSISIVSIMLTVVVSRQSAYLDGVALSNLADEISLSLSQAQAYGIGVKELNPGSGDFTASYGLAFSLLGGSDGSNVAYLSFADRNGNNEYGGNWTCPIGGTSECLKKVNITGGNYIESLCVIRTSDANLCNVERVDISFSRPDTEAQIRFFHDGGNPYSPANIKGAEITLKSPNGLTKLVTVFTTGQISVQ